MEALDIRVTLTAEAICRTHLLGNLKEETNSSGESKTEISLFAKTVSLLLTSLFIILITINIILATPTLSHCAEAVTPKQTSTVINGQNTTKVWSCSWYSKSSTIREGTWQKWGGKTANGEQFDENALTCATWGYLFGARLKVTNLENGKSVICRVTDRGPNMKLYRAGRIVDLSKGAFSRIADLKRGVINVNVEEV